MALSKKARGAAKALVVPQRADIVEPLVDKAAPGSGALGDWYYRTVLK